MSEDVEVNVNEDENINKDEEKDQDVQEFKSVFKVVEGNND